MSMEFSVRGVFCLFTIILLIAYISHVDAQGGDLSIKRSDFPKDFAFGVATSAMQIEGSPKADGRGATIWDTYVQRSGKIKGGNVSLNAIDSYTRYKDDIKIIKDLGISYYRLSISWTRILPEGSLRGGVNQKGIDYYNNVINELLLNGITPFVTILHFDTPQVLEDEYGSFLNRSIVDDFKDYCDLVFKTFGDRVKNWMTINEPFVMALGYDLGIMAPGRCSLPPPLGPCPAGNSATEPYIVGHNAILAHAAGAKLYKDKYQAKQRGQIGIVLVGEYAEPNNPQSPEDKLASERYMDFLFGWYVEPLVFGDYPKSMKTYAKERLPKFTEEEKKLVKGSFDFIGINYYTSRYTKPADHPSVPTHYLRDSFVNSSAVRDGIPIGPKNEASGYIYSYPQGLQKLLEYIKQKYQNPTIYITENGVPEPNVPGKKLVESLNDQHRITFISQHLYYTNQAIKNGANVKGYFYWALFDDFEWADGYFPRFGLYFVDYENNYKRTPKKSAHWFQTFLQDKMKHNGNVYEQTHKQRNTNTPQRKTGCKRLRKGLPKSPELKEHQPAQPIKKVVPTSKKVPNTKPTLPKVERPSQDQVGQHRRAKRTCRKSIYQQPPYTVEKKPKKLKITAPSHNI